MQEQILDLFFTAVNLKSSANV